MICTKLKVGAGVQQHHCQCERQGRPCNDATYRSLNSKLLPVFGTIEPCNKSACKTAFKSIFFVCVVSELAALSFVVEVELADFSKAVDEGCVCHHQQ